jgi:outer membrane translocation and assembly module TamA
LNILQKNIRTATRVCIALLVSFSIIASSCNPTKYVPEGETLLDRNKINLNKEGLKKENIVLYIKQPPNKRIFGARFYLWLYDLSNINKEKWPHGWLRKIGEPPVIFNQASANQSRDQIKSYVASKGYFDGKVKDSTATKDRQTKVFYNIDLQPAYKVRNIRYEVTDTNIRKYFYLDSVNCLIIRGKPYDVDVLTAERNRFEKYIRNMGFYAFSADFVTFRIDSTVGKRQVDIYYNVRNTTTTDNFNRTTIIPHSVYRVKNVYIYPDYDPGKALEQGDAYIQQLDTVLYKGYYFITSNKEQQIKYDLILQTLYVKASADYNLTNTEQTQSHLMSLKVYRLVNINYSETDIPEDETTLFRSLNCSIMLTPLTPQSYKIELEGTNSSGNIGGALNLVYQHKNLFHGAELFSITLRGAYEGIRETRKLKSIQEYGIETSLKLPQFLIPFIRKEGFIKKYNPSTIITTAYNYQSLPLFKRTVATATFGYTWNAGSYVSHIVNPLQLNLVKIPPNSIDSAFAERIKKSYQAYSYRNVLILGGGYSYIYNNSKIKGSKDYWFVRINAETAGNMLSLVKHISGSKDGGNLEAFGQPFAQYVRTDFDVRYYYRFNDVSSIVYRGFVGIGIPYGNSRAIPFEKQYFAGGANSIRAWQVRTLGPGSYSPVTGPYIQNSTIFLNQTADIKLEANAEYRFKLFWLLEGALFVDAGNIWNFYKDPRTPGAEFNIKNFYNDIAVGTGTGFRFDFKFVIARVDVGMKLRDPILLDGSKWIFERRPYSIKRYPSDFSLVFGIGYPF